MSGSEMFDHDYIETPDDAISFVEAKKDAVVDTKKNLDGLQDDVVSSLSTNKEVQYQAEAEQYYQLGNTHVESGNIDAVKNAITQENAITHTEITILWWADQLFMSEAKWQQVLNAEIAKLTSLKAGFSGDNITMIDGLIAELTDSAKHSDLASRYPRTDGRSNLGNARLVAARIASWYAEVLTTIQAKIAETSRDTKVSYIIDWNNCVIWNGGNKLSDRKIHVDITLDTDTKLDEKPWDEPKKVNDDEPKKVNDDEPKKVNDDEPKKVNDDEPKKVNDDEPKKVNDDEPKKVKEPSTPPSKPKPIVDTPSPVEPEFPSIEVETGSQEVVVRFPNHQWDIVTAARYWNILFTKDSEGNYFPDIAKIQEYYAKQWLEVEFIVPSQTFEYGNVLTQHSRDEWVEWPASAPKGDVDHKENDLDDIRAADKGVLWIDKKGVVHFSHSAEITQSDLDNAKDVAILPSVFRKGKGDISNSDKRYDTDPTRYVVLQWDVVSIVTLYGIDKKAKQAVLKKYDRVLYLDVAWVNDQLFGYWTMQDGKLVYGNNKGDVLRDGKIPREVVKGNMPSLLIMTKPKPKKEEPKKIVEEPKKIVEDTKNIDSPFVYGSKEWLGSKLNGKLEGISLDQFYNYITWKSISISYNNPYNKDPFIIKKTIPWIENPVLRSKVLSYIDRGNIRDMYQDIYGMHDNTEINPYLHYRPTNVINGMMLHTMSLRLWHTHDIAQNKEQLDHIKMPDDVRNVWRDYKKLKLNLLSESNWPNNFAIVSKTDFKMYLFLPDGTLVGTQNILVGKNPSDTQRLVSNTPSGKYKTNGFFNKPGFNGKYYDKWLGNYIKLWSLEDKFKNVQKNNTGIGVHELYNPEGRAASLLDDVTKNPTVRDRKWVSDGCINASNSPLDFGAIFTHLVPKSDITTCVYVTNVPDNNAVYNYYSMLQSQQLVVMK